MKRFTKWTLGVVGSVAFALAAFSLYTIVEDQLWGAAARNAYEEGTLAGRNSGPAECWKLAVARRSDCPDFLSTFNLPWTARSLDRPRALERCRDAAIGFLQSCVEGTPGGADLCKLLESDQPLRCDRSASKACRLMLREAEALCRFLDQIVECE